MDVFIELDGIEDKLDELEGLDLNKNFDKSKILDLSSDIRSSVNSIRNEASDLSDCNSLWEWTGRLVEELRPFRDSPRFGPLADVIYRYLDVITRTDGNRVIDELNSYITELVNLEYTSSLA